MYESIERAAEKKLLSAIYCDGDMRNHRVLKGL